MKKDKLRIIGMVILTCLVLGTGLLYMATIFTKGKINLENFFPFIIILIAVLFMVYFIKHKYRDVKEGMPLEDERSRKVMTQAAAMTFYVSIYWLLAISFFEDFFAKITNVEKLDVGQTIGIGIAGMTICFIVAWFYYNRKGKLI